MAALAFYFLAGLSVIAVVFLIMIAAQLVKIEKSIADLSLIAEHRVKRMYGKQ